MSIQIPSTAEVNEQVITALESSLNQSIPFLPKSVIRVMAKSIAAVVVLFYRYAGFIFQQQYVETAQFEEVTVNGDTFSPLIRLGRQLGIDDPLAATQAEYDVTVAVLTQTGSLAAGAQLINPLTGVGYITLQSVLLNAATVTATVRASSDQNGGDGSGTIGNVDPGAIFNFVSPLANVANAVTVLTELTTGADGETEESYRGRVRDRRAQPPQGGAYADYRIWGRTVEGIAQIYPYTGSPGQVDVYVESATEVDGIPTQAQLDDVKDAIEYDSGGLATRRPANAFVNSLAITRTGFIVTVEGLSVSNVAQTQDQIETALTNYFLGREPFIDGLTVPPKTNLVTNTSVVGIVVDVTNANDGTFAGVSVAEASNPTVPLANRLLLEGEKAKLDSVVFS